MWKTFAPALEVLLVRSQADRKRIASGSQGELTHLFWRKRVRVESAHKNIFNNMQSADDTEQHEKRCYTNERSADRAQF